MAAPRKLTPGKERQIAAAYAKGKSSTDIAAKFGVHKDTVRNIVVREGGLLREPGGIKGKPKPKPAA